MLSVTCVLCTNLYPSLCTTMLSTAAAAFVSFSSFSAFSIYCYNVAFCSGLGYSSGSRNSEAYRPAGGSTEDMNGYEELVLRHRGLEPGVSCSTPLNHNSHSAAGFTSSSSRPGRRPKGTAVNSLNCTSVTRCTNLFKKEFL